MFDNDISKKRRGETQIGFQERDTFISNFFFHPKYLNFVYSYSPPCMGKIRLQTNAFYSHKSYAYNMLTSLISLMIYFHIARTFT